MDLSNLRRRLALRSRTVLGLALIAASIIGVFAVISLSGTGTTVILAREFIPAGTTISADALLTVPIDAAAPVDHLTTAEATGQVAGVDLAPGDVVSHHALEPTSVERIAVALPLGVSPATGIGAGSVVSVWSVDEDGIVPPDTIARNVGVVGIADAGFGADTVATVLVDSIDIERVLGALGSKRLIVLTTGEAP